MMWYREELSIMKSLQPVRLTLVFQWGNHLRAAQVSVDWLVWFGSGVLSFHFLLVCSSLCWFITIWASDFSGSLWFSLNVKNLHELSGWDLCELGRFPLQFLLLRQYLNSQRALVWIQPHCSSGFIHIFKVSPYKWFIFLACSLFFLFFFLLPREIEKTLKIFSDYSFGITETWVCNSAIVPHYQTCYITHHHTTEEVFIH